jgi:hypothetical protein
MAITCVRVYTSAWRCWRRPQPRKLRESRTLAATAWDRLGKYSSAYDTLLTVPARATASHAAAPRALPHHTPSCIMWVMAASIAAGGQQAHGPGFRAAVHIAFACGEWLSCLGFTTFCSHRVIRTNVVIENVRRQPNGYPSQRLAGILQILSGMRHLGLAYWLLSALLSCTQKGTVAKNSLNDVGVPLTIEVPSGHASNPLRYHLAHYGAVPYGEDFPRYAYPRAWCRLAKPVPARSDNITWVQNCLFSCFSRHLRCFSALSMLLRSRAHFLPPMAPIRLQHLL